MSYSYSFLLLTTFFLVLPSYTYAFGAGDIPDFAYLNDRAFRHGDIENTLENLVKHVGGAAVGGGLLGFAKQVLKQAAGGSRFSKSDVKKVYFGNWLRDYSQAMDIAGLSKLSADTLVLVVAVLGFMTFGFATEEFEVTADRLGVYLPVEHIDNPKGYAEKEGDARQYHPKLRPPVDSRELEIDERTGMKKYMATENEGWDTSTAFIRRTFQACIERGRRAQGQEGADLWEAYRLLGQGLHTMEDLLAHSNWCEITLRKMGHEEVFCHVGDNVIVGTPNGPAPPIVTGTFGGADFLHSLIGEAGDKLSQASVTDLSQKLDASQGNNENTNISKLKDILSKLPIGGSQDKVNETEELHQKSKAYHFNPDNIAPPEVQKQLLDLLRWRDSVIKDILSKIEMIPGLTDLLDELTNALNAYVYTVLTPYLAPILKQATGALDEGSKAVINNHDQYEVFDNPDASDPSHSLLSKDHFGLILNEPAGKIAQVVVEHTVNLIVQAWSDDSDPNRVIDTILEAFYHPYYATGNSQIQHQMFEEMEKWLGGLGPDEAEQVIQALTKESVRDHKNKRIGSEEQNWEEPGYGGCGSHGAPKYNTPQSTYSSGGTGYQGGASGRNDNYGSSYSSSGPQSSGTYGESNNTGRKSQYGSGRAHGEPNSDRYGSSNTYGQSQQGDTYGSGRTYGEPNSDRYGSSNTYGQSQQDDTYGSGRTYGDSNNDRYGSSNTYRQSQQDDTYGSGRTYGDSNNDRYGSSNTYQQSQERYGSGRQEGYGRQNETEGYSRRAEQPYGDSEYSREEPTESRYESSGYGRQSGYGGTGGQDNNYGGSSYGRQENRYGEDGGEYGGSRSKDNQGRSRRNEDTDGDYEGSRSYGGQSGYGNDEDSYGGSRRRQNEDDSNSYGGSAVHREEPHRAAQGYTPSYSQVPEERGYGEGGYDGGDDEYGSRRHGGRGDNSEGCGRQERSYESGYDQSSSGYAPSYGSGDNTFGAEGLSIRDDDDNEGHSRHHGRRHHHEDEY